MLPLRPRTPWLVAFAAATGCFLMALPYRAARHRFDPNPAPDVVAHMAQHRRSELSATFSVCVGRDGRPEQIYLLTSSGYPDYDERLLSRIQRTRFLQADCFIESFRFGR